MAKAQTNTLALARIDTEEKLLDVRLRLKGKAAVDLADYQRAYAATTGESAPRSAASPRFSIRSKTRESPSRGCLAVWLVLAHGAPFGRGQTHPNLPAAEPRVQRAARRALERPNDLAG